MKLFRILATLALFALATIAEAVNLPGPVVSADWLSKNIGDVQVVMVTGDTATFTRAPEIVTDPKTGKKFVAEVGGHMAGASLFDFKKARVEKAIATAKVKFLIPELAEFEKLVQSIGVNAGKPIVLVPLGLEVSDVDEALRVLWSFKVYGEQNIAVLDGGLAGWLADGKPVNVTPAVKPAGNWTGKAPDSALVATGDEVAEASKTGKIALIDARPAPQFFGITKSPSITAAGHVAGAKNFAPDILTKSANGALYFLGKATYEALLRQIGVDPTAATITYCNTGHLASGAWFMAHEIVGNKNVKLYDGSMHYWTLENRPVVAVPM
ncbi:MAG: sulfurtransferase [Burkholderiaceae bacterium]|nr:sulfurtransferase [Burkholderiaceae bacterium]